MLKSSVTILLVLGLCCSVFGATVYVDAGATGSGSGADWANAKTTLTGVFPGTSGNPIKIAKGTYQVSTTDANASFGISSGVTVEGGYLYDAASGIENRDPKIFETIITADVNGDDTAVGDLFEDPCALSIACQTGDRQDNGNYIFYLGSVSNVTIDGLVLKGVYARAGVAGSALQIHTCSNVTVKNCRFTENCQPSNIRGNALYIADNSTNILVEDCVFTKNSCGAEECSVRVQDNATALGTDVIFRNCMFTGNSSLNHGAAAFSVGDPGWVTVKVYDCMMVRNSDGVAVIHRGYDNATEAHPNLLEMYNTIIKDNLNEDIVASWDAGLAAGMRIHGSGGDSPALMLTKLQGCVIANNSVPVGAGGSGLFIYRNSTPTLINCTIANNSGVNGKGEGVYATMAGTGAAGPIVTEKNCIIWGNSGCDNNLQVPVRVPVANVSYCCIDDSDGDPNNYLGTSGTTSDPLFADSLCHLSLGSPAIDAGDDADSVGSEPKCNGGRINMGAYGGTVNATPTVDGAGTKAGDINCDGEQNLADFQILAGQWLE